MLYDLERSDRVIAIHSYQILEWKNVIDDAGEKNANISSSRPPRQTVL